MANLAISVGQCYIDDDGDEVTVRKVHRSRGIVVLEGEGGSYEMGLEDLLRAVADGEFEELDAEEVGDGNEDDDY
jgi:hypothetical protein